MNIDFPLFVVSLIVGILFIFHGVRTAIDFGNRTILKIEVAIHERKKARRRARQARRNPAPVIAPQEDPYYAQFFTGLTPAEEYDVLNSPYADEPENRWQNWEELHYAATTAPNVSTQPLNPYVALKRGNGRS